MTSTSLVYSVALRIVSARKTKIEYLSSVKQPSSQTHIDPTERPAMRPVNHAQPHNSANGTSHQHQQVRKVRQRIFTVLNTIFLSSRWFILKQ